MPMKNPKTLSISPEILQKRDKMRMNINESIIVKVQSLEKMNEKCTY